MKEKSLRYIGKRWSLGGSEEGGAYESVERAELRGNEEGRTLKCSEKGQINQAI